MQVYCYQVSSSMFLTKVNETTTVSTNWLFSQLFTSVLKKLLTFFLWGIPHSYLVIADTVKCFPFCSFREVSVVVSFFPRRFWQQKKICLQPCLNWTILYKTGLTIELENVNAIIQKKTKEAMFTSGLNFCTKMRRMVMMMGLHMTKKEIIRRNRVRNNLKSCWEMRMWCLSE